MSGEEMLLLLLLLLLLLFPKRRKPDGLTGCPTLGRRFIRP